MAFAKGNTLGKRFQLGQSGNPGGLPAYVRSTRLLAGEKAPRAVHRLSELLEHSDPRIVLAAATALLDRAGVTPLEVRVALGSRNPIDDLAAANCAPELDAQELRTLAATPSSSPSTARVPAPAEPFETAEG